MARMATRQQRDAVAEGDRSFDSLFTPEASAMLAAVDAYVAEHPEKDVIAKIPPKRHDDGRMGGRYRTG